MKKLLLVFASLFFMGLIVAGLCGLYVLHSFNARGPLATTKIVLIERGSGVAKIAQILESEGVVSSSLLFKVATKLSEGNGTLKAGEYELTPQISINEAIELMRDGRVYDRKITFPEGLTSHQIVALLEKSDVLSGDVAQVPKDGSLLPDTYHFIKGDTRESIIKQMQTSMDAAIKELWDKRASDLPFDTVEQAITLASIVEKETGVASERGKVAGVFVNRLRRGIPLQSDPTVIYAMTMGKIEDAGQGPIGRRLLSKDLQIDSPYNTYRYPGIPPSPIANPGRESIAAVLNPEHHDFIYFVADGTGGHAFGRTLAEHNANVAKWRRIRASQ